MWEIHGKLTSDETEVMKEFGLKYPPIVKSPDDTDLYKFSMGQAYHHQYGDAAGDFSLLNRLTKTEVVGLGDYLGLPKELVHKTPSDGMCGKSDEDNLGFTYDELDLYIENGQPSEIAPEKLKKILSMHNNPNTKYKCVQMPSALEDIRCDAFSR